MLTSHSLLLPLFGSAASAANLWATHYSGTINYLSFENNALTLSKSSPTGNNLPSWITYDNAGKALYIPDEVFYGASGGNLVSFAVGNNGTVTAGGKGSTPLGVVATALYGASILRQSSQLTTFKLPLTGGQPLQTIKYTGKGVNPSRQEAPHPHHAFVDPSGDFLVVPDLGTDQIRIHKIDQNSGKLTECASAKPPPGTGPRHGAFWTPSAANSRVRRAAEGNATAVRGTKVGEVKVKGNFVYITNRNDKKFNGNDSLTQYTISPNGSLTWTANTSSYGTYPRTFDINKAGDFVAIGDQTTSNIAIVPRDPKTGKLGERVADLRIGAAGIPENEDGLSAVVWAE
ncbi:unnamed protein product [Alternaria alternata]